MTADDRAVLVCYYRISISECLNAPLDSLIVCPPGCSSTRGLYSAGFNQSRGFSFMFSFPSIPTHSFVTKRSGIFFGRYLHTVWGLQRRNRLSPYSQYLFAKQKARCLFSDLSRFPPLSYYHIFRCFWVSSYTPHAFSLTHIPRAFLFSPTSRLADGCHKCTPHHLTNLQTRP